MNDQAHNDIRELQALFRSFVRETTYRFQLLDKRIDFLEESIRINALKPEDRGRAIRERFEKFRRDFRNKSRADLNASMDKLAR